MIIIGPMYSGKSDRLIHRLDSIKKYLASDKLIHLYQPIKNVRDEQIESRSGVKINALKINRIQDIPYKDVSAIGIDEMHMFDEDVDLAIKYINTILNAGVHIVIAGLDRDYQGAAMVIIQALMNMKGAYVFNLTSVCNKCGSFDAKYTQILKNNEPVVEGLPPVVPEDGTYQYHPRCEDCFLRKELKLFETL